MNQKIDESEGEINMEIILKCNSEVVVYRGFVEYQTLQTLQTLHSAPFRSAPLLQRSCSAPLRSTSMNP